MKRYLIYNQSNSHPEFEKNESIIIPSITHQIISKMKLKSKENFKKSTVRITQK